MCTNSAEVIQHYKKAENARGSIEIFSRLYWLYRLYRTADTPRPIDKRRRTIYFSGNRKRHTVKNQLMVNNHGIILNKIRYKRGKRHDYDVYKKNHPITPEQVVVNVFDLGYLGVE